MGYREVMGLPIRVFWLMNSSIGRLLAEKDIRALTVQSARHGGEQAEQIRQHLVIEMGEVGKTAQVADLSAERDQQGFEELKTLAALM